MDPQLDTAQRMAEAIKLYANLFSYPPDPEKLEAGEDKDYETIMRTLAQTRRDALEEARRMCNNVSRCTCAFTPGCLTPEWKPDLSIGVDGRHAAYCPFGIADALDRLREGVEG